jgi:hypothetical protein
MRREVLATVALAIGVVVLGAAGYLMANGRTTEGIILAVVDVIAVATLLAFGSLAAHK